MLEHVGRLRKHTAHVQHLGLDQSRELGAERRLVDRGDGVDQLVGERPPDRRAELQHVLRRREPVEARHQRLLEGRGNGAEDEGPGELVAPVPLDEDARLEHHLGQLLDVQRHAVDLLADVAHDLLG